jgi:hypothetical protein
LAFSAPIDTPRSSWPAPKTAQVSTLSPGLLATSAQATALPTMQAMLTRPAPDALPRRSA